MVSAKRLQELRLIIKEEYGRNLSDFEVSEIGNQIVGYYKSLIKLKLSQNRDKKQ